MLLAAVPLLVPVVMLWVQRPAVIMAGDQAADEMALMRAEHFAQLVGNYSRSPGAVVGDQWSHPGPAWFYAMDPFYALSGSASWGFAAASTLLHGIVAALIVTIAWRRGGARLAVVASGLLLIYVAITGWSVFLAVWPPFAVLFPCTLLLLLAALAAAGSTPALVGALIAASFVAQLHVATLPIAAVAVATALVLRLLPRHRLEPGSDAAGGRPRHRRRSDLLCAGGTLVLVAMWVPPLIDEVAGTHNLSRLLTYFTHSGNSHTWLEALSALGRELEVFPLGHLPAAEFSDFASVPLIRWVAIGGYLFLAIALTVVALRARDRFAAALGAIGAIAVPVLADSLTRAPGPLYPYFVYWASLLPLAVALGWIELGLAVGPRLLRERGWPAPRAIARGVAVVAAAAGVVLSGLDAGSLAANLGNGEATLSDPVAPGAWRVTERALADYRPQGVFFLIPSGGSWEVAAALMDQLEKRGWRVSVESGWRPLFGQSSAPTGRERVEVVVAGSPSPGSDAPSASLAGEVLGTYIFVGAIQPGTPLP